MRKLKGPEKYSDIRKVKSSEKAKFPNSLMMHGLSTIVYSLYLETFSCKHYQDKDSYSLTTSQRVKKLMNM